MQFAQRPMDHEKSVFSNQCVFKVPVIRIFGITPSGQKACLFVHKVYPYFYVEIPRRLHKHVRTSADYDPIVAEYLQNFGNILESLIRDEDERGFRKHAKVDGVERYKDKSKRLRPYVHDLSVCMKKIFFGYCHQMQPFFKVYLYDPSKIKLASSLCRKSTLMSATRVWRKNDAADEGMQPYEAHISYELQFMVDHNIRGMDFVDVNRFWFREPLPYR